MNRAIQVVTRLAFRLLASLLTGRERRHDGPPLGIAHRGPAGDLLDGASATGADARLAVEQADIDARRFQGGLCPVDGPRTYVGAGALASNCAGGMKLAWSFHLLFVVIAGLDPAIHVFAASTRHRPARPGDPVTPAVQSSKIGGYWMPACAGMTSCATGHACSLPRRLTRPGFANLSHEAYPRA